MKTRKDKVKLGSFPIVHDPQKLVSLLKRFSINDSALKYTTHSWEAGRDKSMFKDLSEFLSMAKAQYDLFSNELNALRRELNAKIFNFLFREDIANVGWGDPRISRRIYFGWSSPELLQACRVDPSLNPEDYVLPTNYQLQWDGRTLQKFKHIVDVFKNQIEIRDENSVLSNLILKKHDRLLQSFSEPIVSNLDNKTFYTDVQWLSKALDMILEGIQSRSQHPGVSYSLTDEGRSYVLEILHINSFNAGKSIKDEKLTLVKGNFGDIAGHLLNLCDWSVESKFAEGYCRINYLTSDDQLPGFQEVDAVPGFKHILRFYK